MGNSSTLGNATLTVSGGTSTFGGVIQNTIGSGNQLLAVTVSGGANLTLTGASAYTGATTINSGSLLQIGNGAAGELFASPTIADSGALVFNHTDALTCPGAITGGGGLTKLGGGQLTLTGTGNTYSGGTTISAGALQIGDGLTTNGSDRGKYRGQRQPDLRLSGGVHLWRQHQRRRGFYEDRFRPAGFGRSSEFVRQRHAFQWNAPVPRQFRQFDANRELERHQRALRFQGNSSTALTSAGAFVVSNSNTVVIQDNASVTDTGFVKLGGATGSPGNVVQTGGSFVVNGSDTPSTNNRA